ncbi:ATP-binding protein [Streptomyces flavofungini]|uniref:ATP-binding protein n=1 Tax=Streptomyces flavofungini TaxID=68200 RepID=UPI0025B116F2|nr:AAA family ATPase [Streptomyces flavofungini]WJV51023.1 AAA family ATPase [Streptomyces flavofungini]
MSSADVPWMRKNGFALVGRERELEDLVTFLRNLPSVVMVEGEAGSGKSRLVREAEHLLTTSGTRVATGLCHPLREPFPYGPVLEALGRVAEHLPADCLLPPETATLATYLPGLAARIDDSRQPATAMPERLRLVLGIRAVLRAAGPVVLVIEDMHWADEATRELLLLIAREPPSGLGLVLTYRAEDLPPAEPVLGSAYRRPIGVAGGEIRLQALTADEVTALATGVVGRVAGHSLGRVLYRRSAGLPLVVEEDLLTLLDRRRRSASQGLEQEMEFLGRSPAPRSLREAVHERLAELPEPAARLVEAAAVLAVPAAQDVLAQVAGLEAEQATAALTQALHRSLLHEPESATYAFRHVLAQQAVYGDLPGPRRLSLHQRAHSALRGQRQPALVQIAHHSKALGDKEAWLREAEEAAGEAVSVGDDGIASQLLHGILGEKGVLPEVRSRVALALCDIAHKFTRFGHHLAIMRRLVDDPTLPVQTRGRVRLTLAAVLMNHAGDVASYRELMTALEELEPWPALAASGMLSAIFYERTQTPAEIDRWVVRAEEALRGCEDEGRLAELESAKLFLMARNGHTRLWETVDALPRSCTHPEVRRQRLIGLYNVGANSLNRGEDGRAGALLREVARLTADGVNPSLECFARTQLLRWDWFAGSWSRLEEGFEELNTSCPDMAIAQREQALVCGSVAVAKGQWGTAMEHLDFARHAGQRIGGTVCALHSAAATAEVHLARDEPDKAWDVLEPAIRLLRSAGLWYKPLGTIQAAVRAGLATGRCEEARSLVEEALAARVGHIAPAADAELCVARGELEQDSDPKSAARWFEEARDKWRTIGRPYPAARAAELLARCRGGAGAPLEPAALDEPLATYSRLGATADVARCRHALRQAGVKRPATPGRRGYGEDLSPREVEVARLLAEGASNRDIAQALCLSVRTVEHHVARTLKKLRVDTRAEVSVALDAHLGDGRPG